MLIIIFACYNDFNVSEAVVIPDSTAGSEFSNGLIILLLVVIFIMLFERFAMRTATKSAMVN